MIVKMKGRGDSLWGMMDTTQLRNKGVGGIDNAVAQLVIIANF